MNRNRHTKFNVTVYRNIWQENGSFTLEAAILFPIMILAVMMFLALTDHAYQQTMLDSKTHLSVERTAYVWNNSAKDIESGSYPISVNDGLYWRWTGNDFFNWLHGGSDSSTYELSEGMESSSLLTRKLAKAEDGLRFETEGRFIFHHDVFIQRVDGDLNQSAESVFYPSNGPFNALPNTESHSSAYIVDPVELNRNVDFLRTVGTRLRDRKVSKQMASAKIEEFLGLEGERTFSSHGQALTYLRKLVQNTGKVEKLETSQGTRYIDAIDKDQVVHQAFLTFNMANLRLQMAKDAELLQENPNINGVVWHFFRKTNQTGKVGPSEAFLKELRSNGITVVIHDG